MKIRIIAVAALVLLVVVSMYAGSTWRDFTERDRACFNLGAVYMLKARGDARIASTNTWGEAAELTWTIYKEDTSRRSRP